MLGHRPHEVAIPARRDVVREAVGLEVAQQLDHGLVAALVVAATERRVLPPDHRAAFGREQADYLQHFPGKAGAPQRVDVRQAVAIDHRWNPFGLA